MEYLEWYNGLRPSQRNEMLVFRRLDIMTQAMGILGRDGIDEIPMDILAGQLAKSIEIECNYIANDKSGAVSKSTIDRKLQLIDYQYDILGGIAEIPSLDSRIASTLKHICSNENRRLKKYKRDRRQESDTEDILSSLQLIASACKMSEKLGGGNESIIKEIKNIYDTNVEKYAPYVLNY